MCDYLQSYILRFFAFFSPAVSAGVPKGTYRKYVPEGIQVPLRARASKSEQCATCNERGARSSPRHLQRARSAKFPAPLATSAEREVPRATCNEREARSSPRHLQRARSAKFPARLATSAKREVPRAANRKPLLLI